MALNFTPRAFELLEGLAANNNRPWYDEHRQAFEAHLREPFAGMLEQATERLEDTRVPLAGRAKTMFRQNRFDFLKTNRPTAPMSAVC